MLSAGHRYRRRIRCKSLYSTEVEYPAKEQNDSNDRRQTGYAPNKNIKPSKAVIGVDLIDGLQIDFDIQLSCGVPKCIVALELSSFSALCVQNEIAVNLVGFLSQVLEPLAIRSSQNVATSELQITYSWDGILSFDHALRGLCLRVVHPSLIRYGRSS